MEKKVLEKSQFQYKKLDEYHYIFNLINFKWNQNSPWNDLDDQIYEIQVPIQVLLQDFVGIVVGMLQFLEYFQKVSLFQP